jgi:hypothetical protein
MHARSAYVSVLPVTCKEGRNMVLFEITATSEILPDLRPSRELAKMKLWSDPTIQWYALTQQKRLANLL